MGLDLHVIVEVKLLGEWAYLTRQSAVTTNNVFPIIFQNQAVCIWYESDKIPHILNYGNGMPEDVSYDTWNEWQESSIVFDGYITKRDIEGFNWDFPVVRTKFEDKEPVPDVPFREFCPEFFEEINYLSTLGEDYRYLYWLE